MPSEIPVLLNAGAAAVVQGAADLVDAVGAEFLRHGVHAQVRALPPDEIGAEVRAAVAQGAPRVVVGGGDGTLSTAAGIIAAAGGSLAILPLGTLNHFALDAGIPPDWRDAVAVAAAGVVRPVDLAEVNGRLFLNTCSLGGYVAALRRREQLRRRAGHSKARAMFWGTIAALRRVPRLRVSLLSPERDLTLRASFVLVVNNRYQDDVIVSGRRSRLDSGRLCVYTSHVHRYRDLLHTLLEIGRRGIHRATQLEFWETQELEIACATAGLHGALDGEIVPLDAPLRLRSRPGALQLVVPPRP